VGGDVNAPPYARALNVRLCHGCGLACDLARSRDRCPRCGARLQRRKPNSVARTWAFMLAALVCYIPANVMPVMYTNLFGNRVDSTIIAGVADFWNSGAWDIAVIIFIASIGIPAVKFVALTVLLMTVQRNTRRARRQRARLYRFVEVIGYWSMLDVLVVALVAALVKFQRLGDIEPRPGIVFFGLVVVLTMLAAMSFDPRLIWDGESGHER
jgi:paraquat-inducible protein A